MIHLKNYFFELRHLAAFGNDERIHLYIYIYIYTFILPLGTTKIIYITAGYKNNCQYRWVHFSYIIPLGTNEFFEKNFKSLSGFKLIISTYIITNN